MATFAAAVLEVISKTAAIGIGGAVGVGLVFGGAKLIRLLKRRPR